MPTLEDNFGFSFDPASCNSCNGFCCRGESGFIFLGKDEAAGIAAALQLEWSDFETRYLRKVGYKFSLQEKRLGDDDFACIFFDDTKGEEGCRIYDVRPKQCQTFPFWETFRKQPAKALRECPFILPR